MEQNIAFERCVDFLARMKIQSQRKWVSKMSASIFYILNILKN